MTVGRQYCNECKVEKPLDQFRKNAHSITGVGYRCKECIKRGLEAMPVKRVPPPPTRVCRICGKEKPIDLFCKVPRSIDGYGQTCKGCRKGHRGVRESKRNAVMGAVITEEGTVYSAKDVVKRGFKW